MEILSFVKTILNYVMQPSLNGCWGMIRYWKLFSWHKIMKTFINTVSMFFCEILGIQRFLAFKIKYWFTCIVNLYHHWKNYLFANRLFTFQICDFQLRHSGIRVRQIYVNSMMYFVSFGNFYTPICLIEFANLAELKKKKYFSWKFKLFTCDYSSLTYRYYISQFYKKGLVQLCKK